MYTDAMKEIYGNVTKVLVDSNKGSNLLYLPLDKIMDSAKSQQSFTSEDAAHAPASSASGNSNAAAGTSRAREVSRSRDRDPR